MNLLILDDYMVPFHVDNGLYLMITPYPGHGLEIKTSSGTIVKTDSIESDSVIGKLPVNTKRIAMLISYHF